jgi:hypothetical protein
MHFFAIIVWAMRNAISSGHWHDSESSHWCSLQAALNPLLLSISSLGFKQLNYVATTGGAGTGHFYWIDQNHAGFIGRALARKNLDYLGIEFTTVAIGDCWRTLADQAEGASICELCIAHKSADEETEESCKALAYLVTKLKVQTHRSLNLNQLMRSPMKLRH